MTIESAQNYPILTGFYVQNTVSRALPRSKETIHKVFTRYKQEESRIQISQRFLVHMITSISSQSFDSLVSGLRALTWSDPECLSPTQLTSITESVEA